MSTLAMFLQDESGQDFAEYALLLGTVAAVAAMVIYRYKNELRATFEYAIAQLQAARR